jgi:hypothetical protein
VTTDLTPFELGAELAVQHFWQTRALAVRRQGQRGSSDQGERAGVTAGHNMDGFAHLFAEVARANARPGLRIHVKKSLVTLPGFFRPTKTWDLVIVHDGLLVAVIEFKSQVGPSFGNNFNNRAEEAIGAATDFWTAHREGMFGASRDPFLGWLTLVEDCPASRESGRPTALAHFPAPAAFQGASYLQRYDLFCSKLMREDLYTSAAVVATPRDRGLEGVYTDVSETTGMRAFANKLAMHVRTQTPA